MMGRKKRILIITLSIITVLILIIGGVLIYLNCATDTFKSTQELFYKYLYQNGDIADVFDTNLLDRYYQKIENNAYNGKGELTIKTGNTDGTESDTKQFDDFINKTKIEYNTKSNLTEKKAETEAKIIYDNKEQFKMNFARNDNNYAVKSDEVVYKYLLLRNENLREVYTKLGIENIDKIPNQFEKIDYNIYKDMKPEDKGRILSTYQNVLNKEILSNHYTKQKIPMQINGKEMKGNVYTLTLTEEELSSLKIKLLETLMTDELTLKYVVQFLQLDGSYTIKIKQAIQEEIDDLKREQIQDNGFIKIMVYECNMKLINTRIETKEYNYTIDNKYSEGNQKVELIKSSNDGNNIVTKINIERITSDAKNSFKIEQVSTTGETITDKNTLIIEIKGNIERDNLEVNVTLENLIGNKSNIINYNNKKEFTNNVEVVNLTNDNSVILNDMTLEEIDSLYKSVVERIQYLYAEKLKAIGFEPDTINYQATLKWSRIVDAFDEDEFKSQVQRALNLAKDDLQNKENYKTLIEEAAGDENKVKQIKGLVTVERLKETGLDATLNETDNSISIKTNSETAHKYEIDYENFKISKIQ
ncbi:MAG: DUF6583 family protein [Clostridia bacterium]|jgi:hypothetical protein|nr:hypothetical protein [Clostridium sp.]MEE0127581.1 DUF6583 family protein [Clostridia bacterium]HJJ12456.1 hypothetical protein [Clostridiaceae bacterium]